MKIEWVKFCLIVVVNFINEMAAISNDDCPFAMNGWMMSIINSYSIFIQTNGEKQRFYCQILSRDLAFIFYISAILIWYWIWDFHHHFRRMMMMKIWIQTTINESSIYFLDKKLWRLPADWKTFSVLLICLLHYYITINIIW